MEQTCHSLVTGEYYVKQWHAGLAVSLPGVAPGRPGPAIRQTAHGL